MGCQRELAGDDVGCRRADERQGDDSQTQIPREIEKRQREDVEGRVTTKDRIDLSEGRGVQKLQRDQPLAGGNPRHDDRNDSRDPSGQETQVPPFQDDRLDVTPAREDRIRSVGPSDCQPEVGEQHGERSDKCQEAEETLGRQALDEHRLVADLAKPQPLGKELSEWQRDQRDQ